MSLFLRPVQFDSEQDPFRGFDLNTLTFDMVASADLAAEFGVPVCNIPFETFCRNHGRASYGYNPNILGKET